MKTFIIAFLTIAILTVGLVMPAAADQILDTKIDSATIALTKNGNQYVRFIITEDRKLDGVAYKRGIPVMAFGEQLVGQAKAMKAGDALKAIVSYRKLGDGRESYTILSFVK